MQSTFEWMSLIAQVGLIVVMVDIAWHIRQINTKIGVSPFLGDKRNQIARGLFHHELPPCGLELAISYSIWVFRAGSWVLHTRCGQAGCDCGPPPSEPGEYEGKVIRK